jgi:hypothetical protein
MVLFGQAQGVGLLIAAKSILRFGAVKDDRRLSEYVIIGTLASFGWALIVGLCDASRACTAAPAWNSDCNALDWGEGVPPCSAFPAKPPSP